MEDKRFFLFVGLEIPADKIVKSAQEAGITEIHKFCEYAVDKLLQGVDTTPEFKEALVGNLSIYDASIPEERYRETGRCEEGEENFIKYLKNE